MNSALEQYQASSADHAARRDALVMQHLPQVTIVARRIHRRLPPNYQLDDLISAGVVGLLEAIDRYDAAENVQLNTFAEHRIRGAILDSLRAADRAPRQTRKRARQIEAAIHSAKQRIGAEPSDEDIAAELSIGLEEYHQCLVSLQHIEMEPLGFVSKRGDETNWLEFLPDDEEQTPARIVERSELERTVTLAIERMPKVERAILTLYYFEELTLAQIGRVVGLHTSRVAELRAQGVFRLRSHLNRVWPKKAK